MGFVGIPGLGHQVGREGNFGGAGDGLGMGHTALAGPGDTHMETSGAFLATWALSSEEGVPSGNLESLVFHAKSWRCLEDHADSEQETRKLKATWLNEAIKI